MNRTVLLAEVMHETNTFNRVPTTRRARLLRADMDRVEDFGRRGAAGGRVAPSLLRIPL